MEFRRRKGGGKFALVSLVPSDVVGRVFAGFRTLTEAPTVSDAASRVFTGFRTTSENLASTITSVVNKGLVKSLTEAISITDIASKSAARFVMESLVPSDVVGRGFSGARVISDNSVSAISDSVTKLFHGFRSTSESIVSAIADTLGKGVGKFLRSEERRVGK